MSGFTYRKVGSDFFVSLDGWSFGRLSDCEFTHVYEGYKAEEISAKMEGDMSIRERLAVIKSVMSCQTAEERAIIYTNIREAARKRGDRVGAENANRAVEQACHVIRTRGANWNPPIAA
jgi:hypothetical protein